MNKELQNLSIWFDSNKLTVERRQHGRVVKAPGS